MVNDFLYQNRVQVVNKRKNDPILCAQDLFPCGMERGIKHYFPACSESPPAAGISLVVCEGLVDWTENGKTFQYDRKLHILDLIVWSTEDKQNFVIMVSPMMKTGTPARPKNLLLPKVIPNIYSFL